MNIDKILRLITEVQDMFLDFEKFLEIEASKILFIGDLHGDKSSYKIIHRYILKNINNFEYIIFLGDYIDRGNDSLFILYNLLKSFKKYKEKIILLRGNHEYVYEIPIIPHTFLNEILNKFGNKEGKIVYYEFLKLFKLFPVCGTLNKIVWFSHAAFPIFVDNENLIASTQEIKNKVEKEDFNTVVQILYNDFNENIKYFMLSRRGVGFELGNYITYKFMNKNKLKLIIRGHQVFEKGFKTLINKKVITLISCYNVFKYFMEYGAFIELRITEKSIKIKIIKFR